MSNSSDQASSESGIDQQQVTELCDRFKAERTGDAALPLEEFLNQHLEGLPTEVRAVAFRELLRTALELDGVDQVDVDSLRTRFPDMTEIITSLAVGANETVAFQGGSTSISSKLNLSGHASGTKSMEPPEVLGRYTLEKELGRGGMGSVHLARDTKLDRLVALKIPLFGGDDSDILVERFYREARTMAAINHVNLCTVHDVCEIDGFHCLVMEFVDGGSLCSRLETDRLIPQDEAVTLTAKLARALQLAHDAGVVHRDIKPANVLMRKDQEPVLTDFGLARMLFPSEQSTDGGPPSANSGSRLTQSGALIGTPMYMSPEQVEADHDNMGPATDIYSLGVVMYLLISGHLPFEGSVARVLGKIITQEPPAPSSHNPQIDEELEAICLKAMAKIPEDRHASAAELATALENYQLQKTQSSLSPPVVASTTRNKLPAAAVAIVGLVLVAVVVSKLFDKTADTPSPALHETASTGAGSVTMAATEPPDTSLNSEATNAESIPAPKPVPADISAQLPPADVIQAFDSSVGLVTEDFAACFQMPMQTFRSTAENLRASGFAPVMIRTWSQSNTASVAAIWRPGNSDWHLRTAMTFDEFQAEDAKQVELGLNISSLCANQERLTAVWTRSSESTTWKYRATTKQPDDVFNPNEALARKNLRPVTVHATPRTGLIGLTQIWKPEPDNWEQVRSRSVKAGETTYDPGDGLLDVCLLPMGPTVSMGIFLWQDLPDIESKFHVTDGLAGQAAMLKELSSAGWYPVSLTVAGRIRVNTPAVGSVWHRKLSQQ